jgi:virginiamycin B lyase
MWVVLRHEWKVVRIDPATNKVVATIPIGSTTDPVGPEGITAANGYVYVDGNNPLDLYLERIDPATNSVTHILQAPGYACDDKAADGNDVWLATQGCDGASIDEVDAASKTIVAHVALGGPLAGVSIGLGAVWAITPNELIEIDPATHAITGRVSFPQYRVQPLVTTGEGALWLALSGFVYRIAP